jgi:hypothetical protein
MNLILLPSAIIIWGKVLQQICGQRQRWASSCDGVAAVVIGAET